MGENPIKNRNMIADKEPESLASIAVSRDEIATHHRPVGKMRSVPTQGSSSKWLWLLVIVLMTACGALFAQVQQLKQQGKKQVQALSVLQERLTSTDEQANLSVDAIKILLKEQDHEIRKLWDLANKRNKNDIAEIKEKVDDQGKIVAQYQAKIGQVEKSQNKNAADIKAVQASTETSLNSLQADTKKSIASIRTDLDKGLKSIPSNLEKTLSSHEKGIKAMDATRLQLMKRIQQLEKEIKALQAPVPATPTAAQ